jgi:ribulose-phosphate 3-epimerase
MRVPKALKIAPSILSCDFARLGEEVERLEAAGCDWLHVDVMDGHFVPNLTIGPPVVKAIRRVATLPLDVHIMISEPERYVDAFCEAGADLLTFHVEAATDPVELCERIRAAGVRPGVAIRPSTSLRGLEAAIGAADMVLVMTVEPGFGGQAFMADQVGKVASVFDMVGGRSDIQVDGGINGETVVACGRAGANVIVAGSYVFRADDLAKPIAALRAGWQRGATWFQEALSHSVDELTELDP